MTEPLAVPGLEEIEATARAIAPWIVTTPIHRWRGLALERAAPGLELVLKLELFQIGGSFKPRGALAVMLGLGEEERARGVVAVSAGNHAIATAYAARALGSSAKVVMMASADPLRIERCRQLGAEVILEADVHAAFARVEAIRESEGRSFVHPFEGPRTALGTATCGLEMARQAPELDVVLIPIGGGGLAAGMSTAFKQVQPRCRVIGIEPTGADSMHRSFAAGEPVAIERVDTIADSLGAPFALPYSFGLCRAHIDELVLIGDDDMRRAMRLLLDDLRLAVEPAGAAATAAAIGPLRGRLDGLRVGAIVCGATIDLATFAALIDA
jgi:threonine dehydratase